MAGIPGFSIDSVAADAGGDPDVLRLENLDTDLPPPVAAVQATRAAVGRDEANSYLPFIGSAELREAVTRHIGRLSGQTYDPETEVVITAGGTEGLLDALLAVTAPGDEILLTDPTYAGMINRVRLVGAVPRLVPLLPGGASAERRDRRENAVRRESAKRTDRSAAGEWRLDLCALRQAARPGTRALFLMNPSMPSGAVLNAKEWEAVCTVCVEHDAWLIYNAAMERILFRGRPCVHPASFPGMRARTLTVGSVSKEYRMIGWRIGWVTGPARILSEVARAHIYNVVTPSGFAQAGALAALRSPEGELAKCVAVWERRHDLVLEELAGFPVHPAAGGWSLLLDVGALGLDARTASRRLLELGRVAATPMTGWGGVNGDRFVRLVFSNEPVERLRGLKGRVTRALG